MQKKEEEKENGQEEEKRRGIIHTNGKCDGMQEPSPN
jgi:hypothetical protein